MLTIFDNFDHFQQSWQFLTIFNNLNNFWQFWQILTILTIFTIFYNDFLGICIVLCGDIMLQLERKGSISNITKPFIAIFVVNILLWIDFNVTMARRQKRQREPPTNRFVVYKGHLGYHRPETLLMFRSLEASLETTAQCVHCSAFKF